MTVSTASPRIRVNRLVAANKPTPDLDFGSVEKALEKRQQRLCAIHVQKRAGARNHRGKDGQFE
jgi:hypothetical protein